MCVSACSVLLKLGKVRDRDCGRMYFVIFPVLKKADTFLLIDFNCFCRNFCGYHNPATNYLEHFISFHSGLCIFLQGLHDVF